MGQRTVRSPESLEKNSQMDAELSISPGLSNASYAGLWLEVDFSQRQLDGGIAVDFGGFSGKI
jgi:hypothetical protein